MSRTFRVALVQLRATELVAHEAAWETLLQRIDEAARGEPDLIVLPEASYPAYFLHSIETYENAGVLADTEVERVLADRARRHGCEIAVGLVQRGDARLLQNVAVVFGRDGAVLARQPKRFLWHFDRNWFTAGQQSEVITLASDIRAGLVICADTRLPEITRSLAQGGARLLIDCTAWVTWGRDAATLSSPQVEYMLPARAIEGGTWIVAADKVGVEADSIVYAGHSGVVDPSGRWVARAPADQAGIVVHSIDLDAAPGPPIPLRRELIDDAASSSTVPFAERPGMEPPDTRGAVRRLGVVTMEPEPSAVDLMEQLRTLIRTLATQQVEFIVLPDLAGTDASAISQQECLPLLETVSGETGVTLAVLLSERERERKYKTLYVVERGELLALHRQTHLSPAERDAGFSEGRELPRVVPTAVGRVGLLAGSEGLVPELGRALKLDGAEIIVWSAGAPMAAVRTIARTRAAEERLYVAAAASVGREGGGYIVDPAGIVLAETLADRRMAASADINRLMTRWDRMAPGTNPILEHRASSAGRAIRRGSEEQRDSP